MIIKSEILILPEGDFEAEVIQLEDKDRSVLYEIYTNWRGLCNNLNAVNARGVNLPEGLSENAFCLEMNTVRTTKSIKGKVNNSFDAYNLTAQKRIQIKACRVLPDLTSFGPKSVWDELYFIDFYRNGDWDGTFDIYFIPSEYIYNHKVNATQTMKDQQLEGRRPRFSIYKEIIQTRGILPVKCGNLI